MTTKRCLLFSLLLLGALSCQRCQPAAPSPLQTVPADATGALLLEPAGALAKALQGALTYAGATAEQAADLNSLKAELGFDPTTVEGLRSAGIDPARPAALAGLAAEGGRGDLIAVLPCADPKVFEQTARRLAERMGRAEKAVDESVANLRGLRFVRSFGDREIVLGGLVLDPARKLAFVSLSGSGPKSIERLLTTTPEQSLERTPAFATARGRVKPGPLLVWLGPQLLGKSTAALGLEAPVASYTVASAGIDAGGLWIGALLGLEPAGRERVQQALTLGSKPPDIFALASRDAVLAATGTANVPALLATYDRADAQKNRQLEQVKAMANGLGVDLNRAVVERLRGGVAAAISIDANGPLLVRPNNPGQMLRAMLGRTVMVQLVVDVTDAGAADLLTLIDQYFTKNNIVVGTRSIGNTEVHFAATGAVDERVEWHYALQDKRLLVGIGTGASFDQLLTRAKGAGSGPLTEALSPAVRSALVGQNGGALYLSFGTLARQLVLLAQSPALDEPAIRSGLIKAAETTSKIDALALRANVDDEGLRLELRLEPATHAAASAPAEKRAP